MKFWSLHIIVLSALAISACSKADRYFQDQLEEPVMQTTFDAEPSKYILSPGTNTVTGTAVYNDGAETKIALNSRVRMFPVTAYSSEYLGHIFKGQSAVTIVPSIHNIHEEFLNYTRNTVADADGNFTFYGIPAGDYYVYTTVTGPSRRGAAIYKRIIVTQGQALHVQLDGQ